MENNNDNKVKSTGRLRCALYRLHCAFVDDSFYLIDNGAGIS